MSSFFKDFGFPLVHPLSGKEKERECDYDENPTILYQIIHERDWDLACKRANAFPEEVSTWVSRKDPKTLRLRWRILPIHGAILNHAPIELIETLAGIYPDGSQFQDDCGFLPIHLAVKKHVKPECLNVLLASYPDCVDVESYRGLTPYMMSTTSSSPHKEYYLRALKRGTPTNKIVTTSLYADLFFDMKLPSLSDAVKFGVACLSGMNEGIGKLTMGSAY